MKVKVKLEKRIGITFQDLILKLSQFWVRQGCVLQQPYDVEVGAGTMHPETFLRGCTSICSFKSSLSPRRSMCRMCT